MVDKMADSSVVCSAAWLAENLVDWKAAYWAVRLVDL